MSATNAPFGFVAVRHPSGECRAKRYPIASGYATAMYKGMPVILSAGGMITAGTAAADLIGILAGVEYTDAVSGKPVKDNNWPAGQTVPSNTTAYAWVYDDPNIEFLVQADGSIPATSIGDQTDVSNVANNAIGMSQSTVSATLAGSGLQGQFRIVEFDESIDNAAGDAFTKVIVKIARHQYIASKVEV